MGSTVCGMEKDAFLVLSEKDKEVASGDRAWLPGGAGFRWQKMHA